MKKTYLRVYEIKKQFSIDYQMMITEEIKNDGARYFELKEVKIK